MSRRTRFIDRLTQPAGTSPALVWAACILLILALTVIGFPKGALSTDILDLLPSSSADVRTGELAQAATRGIADRVIWAVREDASNPGAADEFVRSLWERRAPFLRRFRAAWTKRTSGVWLEAMRRVRTRPARREDRLGTSRGQGKGSPEVDAGQLYSPVAGVTGDEWRADPWLLLRSVMMSQGRGMPTLDDGWITAKDSDGRSWRLLTGRVPVSALSGDGLKAWIAAEADIRRAVLSERPDAAIAGQGVLYYSHHAASQAEGDMKRLGSLSCVLLAVFIFVAFRSFRPVLLCLLSVSAGALCGTAATLAVFGSLHAVTLVMCLSLIGISADYTTYYLMRRRWAGGIETPAGTLVHLRPSLLHALLTTVTAYALMLAAPFPGLRQLALFAVCGLAGAWLTVVAWFPFLVKGFPVRPLPARSLLSAYADAWTQGRLWTKAFLVLFACVSVFGVARLSVNDDLSALQTPPVRLAAEEKVISSLLGIGFSQTWFAATGKTGVPPVLQHLGTVSFRGEISGYFTDLVTYGEVRTDIGTVKTDLKFGSDKEKGYFSYSGAVKTAEFELGKLLNNDKFGKVTFNMDLKGNHYEKKYPSITMKGLVASIDYSDYTYENITLDGEYKQGGFNGNVTLDDENGAIQLNGAINTAGKTPTFNFHAAVSHFRPNTLHLTPKYKDTELSVKIKADFTGSSINDMNGEINIDSLQYTAPDQNFFMDNLRIAATQNDEHQKRLTINSNFLRGTIEGDYSYQTLPASVLNIMRRYIPALILPDKRPRETANNFYFDLHIYNTEILSTVFQIPLKVYTHSTLKG